MRAFMKVTVAGGFLFLVPLVLTVLLVREVLQFARKLFAPLARLLPAEHVAGIAVVDLLSSDLRPSISSAGRAGERMEQAALAPP